MAVGGRSSPVESVRDFVDFTPWPREPMVARRRYPRGPAMGCAVVGGRRWGRAPTSGAKATTMGAGMGTGVGRKSGGASDEVAMELGSAVLSRVCGEEERRGSDKVGPAGQTSRATFGG
jgi:hypothetical protein